MTIETSGPTRPVPVPTRTRFRGTRIRRPWAAASMTTAAVAVTVVLWASAFIAIRAVGADYGPGSIALGRLTVGAVALSVAMVLRARRTTAIPGAAPVRARARILPLGRPLLLVLGYGVLWFGLYAVFVNAAERHLDAGTTAMLVNIGPIFIAVLAGRFLGEGFPRPLVAGLLVAFSGVVVIAVSTSTGRHDALGVLFGVGAAALYAAGVLLQKQALARVDPLTTTWLGCVAGAASCLPFAPSLVDQLAAAPMAATVGIVYLGLFPTAIAYATWTYALSRTTAGKLSSTTYLVPALTVVLSWQLLAEPPALLSLGGGLLCLAGVTIARLPVRSDGRRPRTETKSTV